MTTRTLTAIGVLVTILFTARNEVAAVTLPVVTWVGPTNGSSFLAGSDIRMTARATDSDGSVSFMEFFAGSTNLGQAVSATDVYEFVWSNAPSGTFRLRAEAVDNEGGRGTSDPGFPETAILIAVGATQPAATLNNPSPDGNDAFGNSVAISDSYLVVGTDVHNPGATESGGAAYVYDLASATPTTPAVILTNPSSGIDVFGKSVAVSGTYAVVGAPFDDTRADATGTAYGSAYVYDLASATPTVPMATLTNPTPEVGDVFSWSVAISGTLVVVGAPNDSTAAWRAGSAYVYDMASLTPAVPVATLNKPNPGPGEGFGRSVAVSGTRAVSTAAGKVYVYELTSAPPLLVATLTNENGFGSSVAISGTRVVVGDASSQGGPGPPPPPEAGSVYIFDLASATPTEPVTRLDNPDPTVPGSDFFAASVAITGTRVVVGAYAYERSTREGSAHVYDLASATPTIPVVTLNNPYPGVNDSFGWSVAIAGTRILVGASRDDTSGFDAGSAYLYDFAVNTAPVARVQIENSVTFFDQPTVITLNSSSGTVVLDGSQSSDAENDPLTCTWSVGNPPEAFATGARATAQVPHGSYVFQLQVSDGELTGAASASVAVLTPCDAIAFLSLRIEESSHPNGLKHPLLDLLTESCNSFDKGKVSKGIEQLKAFQVKVAEKLGEVDPALAELLIHEAQTLIDAIPTEYPTAKNKRRS